MHSGRFQLYALLLLSTFLLISIAVDKNAAADTIFLKNGRAIECARIWEEGDIVKAKIHGAVVGYPKDSIERIVKADKKSLYYYRDEILGQHCKIILYFTSQSRLLSKIEVQFSIQGSQEKEQFLRDLKKILHDRYGKSFQTSSSLKNGKSTYWRSGKDGMVELNTVFSVTKVIYKDFEYIRIGNLEAMETEGADREDYMKSDSSKF